MFGMNNEKKHKLKIKQKDKNVLTIQHDKHHHHHHHKHSTSKDTKTKNKTVLTNYHNHIKDKDILKPPLFSDEQWTVITALFGICLVVGMTGGFILMQSKIFNL